MKSFKFCLFSSVVLCSVGCTPLQEKPDGWYRVDGGPVEQAAASAAIEKCDYIRVSRTAKIDADAPAFMGLMKARECMKNEGYEIKK